MEIRPITNNDFELILDLDRKVYPTENPVNKEILSNWYKKNPEFGIIFEDKKEIVAVAIIIPLNKNGWRKLTQGKLLESELNNETLFDYKRDKQLYLHVYHLEKLKPIKHFYKPFLGALKKVTTKISIIGGFSGLCVTADGIGLFENKFRCLERAYVCNEQILEKNKVKIILETDSKEKIESKKSEGHSHLTRCKMLVLYPNEKSIVWDYLKNKSINKEEAARESVFKKSEEIDGISIKGYNFDEGINYEKLIDSYATTGAQASNLAQAIKIIEKMRKEKSFIYLGYTSNMVTSGLRDIFRYLVKHKMVNVIVTTAGGIEEDIIKCLGNFKLGSFREMGAELREKGINRAGNILIPNSRYCKFEDFILPILEKHKNEILSPSKLIRLLGKEINDEKSIYYWAQKNNIPVLCPEITDGSIGDMIYFFKNKNPNFKVDVSDDIVEINNSSIGKEKTGVIILGAGVIKHHILNANLFRNGADYAVYINNAQENDASDAGALPEEAISWGKLTKKCESVKVYGDATILFPLIVAKTFAKD